VTVTAYPCDRAGYVPGTPDLRLLASISLTRPTGTRYDRKLSSVSCVVLISALVSSVSSVYSLGAQFTQWRRQVYLVPRKTRDDVISAK
jgi:hypothetical protein